MKATAKHNEKPPTSCMKEELHQVIEWLTGYDEFYKT